MSQSQILIVAEHDGHKLSPGTARAVTCARGIAGGEITVLVLAQQAREVAALAAQLAGVNHVVALEHERFAHPLAAVLAPVVAAVAGPFSHLLAPSSTFGKDLLPRVAALLDTAQISDIMAVESPRRFKRPTYAGNALVTLEVPEGTRVIGTVRNASFEQAPAGGSADVKISALDLAQHPKAAAASHTRFVSVSAPASDRPDLASARRVVSGGRALGSAENFQLLYTLASRLGAAVGASRAAVDAGYAPNEMQVGQTGKIIAPELYVAIGISGAIQHLTGIKDARTIVAINKDASAPIFEVADIGLVGDLFEIIPELTRRLS
jgi:electron transfer flavoprotein alpha subunit